MQVCRTKRSEPHKSESSKWYLIHTDDIIMYPNRLELSTVQVVLESTSSQHVYSAASSHYGIITVMFLRELAEYDTYVYCIIVDYQNETFAR